MSEMEFEELDLDDVYEGDPDPDIPRHIEGVQDDGDEPLTRISGFIAAEQRDTPGTMEWYDRFNSNPPFDPDQMCLKICRSARNIAGMHASAKEAQDATPKEFRVYKIENIRRGMIMYLDTVGDSNPFGHIVTVIGRVRGVDRSKLESLIVWTNSVQSNRLTKVRGNYFRDHWGDDFQFAATWLNGQELKLPSLAPAPVPEPRPEKTERRLHVMHTSLQVQDTRSQITTDVSKIFRRANDRRVAWITGTEAFGPKVNTVLEAAGEAYGYRVERAAGQDSWIAVRKSLIAGNFQVHWTKIVEGNDVHRDLGVFAVEFDTDNMGRFTIISNHLLTARQPNAHAKNLKVTQAVGRYAAIQAKGSSKVFYGSDQNIRDRTNDTFMGVPFTSVADELKKYEPTHEHGGDIDCIATFDADGNVHAGYIRVLNDSEFKLYGDHFVVEAGLDIKLV